MNVRGRLLPLCVLAAVLSVAGCTPQTVDNAPETPGELPTYRELVDRYNANIDRLDQMWCRAVVEMNWRDEDGKKRYQQGDGVVMMILPDRLALSVSKVRTLLWMGCDQSQYWFIDLQRKKDRKAYFGRHKMVDAAIAADLPMAARAAHLPLLLGLQKIDSEPTSGTTPTVRHQEGMYVIEPPDMGARIVLDPKTALPVSVELLNVDGNPAIVSSLSKPERVAIADIAKPGWPRIMRRISLRIIDSGETLTLHLRDMTDARAPKEKAKRKALGRAFDFEFLAGSYPGAEVVDLDAEPTQP